MPRVIDWVSSRLTLLRRAQILFLVLAIVAMTAPAPVVERLGDRYQIALPVLALGCAAVNGQGLAFAGRYAVMFAGLHGTKRGLGDLPIAHRPRGGLEGFPSGHTATASFGAAALVQSCLMGAPVAQVGAILAAAYTGASRIESRAHDIWQVMAGAIWGIFCAMAFRPASRARAGAARVWGRIHAALRRSR